LKYQKRSNLESLVVSGGGEPTLEMNTIEKLIKEANFNYFEIITGAQWTANDRLIHKHLGRIQSSISERKKSGHNFKFSLRVSIDTFHQEVVKLERIGNLVNILREDSVKNESERKYPDISLFFRTLLVDGENTADLLSKHLGADISSMNGYVREIKFRDNGIHKLNIFTVFYKDMRFVGHAKDMEGVGKTVEFEKFIESYSGNGGDVRLGMSYLKPGSTGEALNGINVFVSYDGLMMLYGGTPDITLNINNSANYEEYVSMLTKDVISRTLLFNGLRHVEEIAEEVEPDIFRKIEKKNWLASLADESLATPELRLYITIRLLQKDIETGNIELDTLPSQVIELISTPKSELIKLYQSEIRSKRTEIYVYGSEKIQETRPR